MTYDARYRISKDKLTTATSIIADMVGNITQIHDAVDVTYNRDFGYDGLNHLATANSGSQSFSYVGTTPKLQAVSGTSSTTVIYDAAGNDLSVTGAYSARNLYRGMQLDAESVTPTTAVRYGCQRVTAPGSGGCRSTAGGGGCTHRSCTCLQTVPGRTENL